jgi:hypothetical protein
MNIGSSRTARRDGAATLTVDTSHGVYDALPVREPDEAPDMATHTVYHESGALAGFAAPGTAWDASGTPFACPLTLTLAVLAVVDTDPV